MLDRTATVLLVDDSPDDRFLLGFCWEKAGIPNPLLTLDDGQQAIDYLARAGRARPGLVMLDLKMPVRNGLEVLAWMRGSPTCRRVPVIVFTASDQPDDIDKAYVAGANSYLVKPSSVVELIELLGAIKEYWLRFNEYPSG